MDRRRFLLGLSAGGVAVATRRWWPGFSVRRDLVATPDDALAVEHEFRAVLWKAMPIAEPTLQFGHLRDERYLRLLAAQDITPGDFVEMDPGHTDTVRRYSSSGLGAPIGVMTGRLEDGAVAVQTSGIVRMPTASSRRELLGARSPSSHSTFRVVGPDLLQLG